MEERWEDYCDIDVAIAVDYMTLWQPRIWGLEAAGSVFLMRKKCHELLALPDNLEPIALLLVGYPKGTEIRREKVLMK